MTNLTCPAGMKLISGDVDYQPILSAEPPFCLDEFEVSNAEYDRYEAAQPKSHYELIVSHTRTESDWVWDSYSSAHLESFSVDYPTVESRGDDPVALAMQGFHLISTNPNIAAVDVELVATSDRPKDPKYSKPNEPVVSVTWDEAEAYCEAKGGYLPRGNQWAKAAYNPYGVEKMFDNVAEWTLE